MFQRNTSFQQCKKNVTREGDTKRQRPNQHSEVIKEEGTHHPRKTMKSASTLTNLEEEEQEGVEAEWDFQQIVKETTMVNRVKC